MGNARTNHHNHPHSPPANTANMGRVRTKTVKKSAKVIIERYYPKLTLDFETNKRICDEIAIIASKRLRNKIAGYTTHLMRRIQRGPVRGISFKLQEEERERKDQYVPEISALDFAASTTAAKRLSHGRWNNKNRGMGRLRGEFMHVTTFYGLCFSHGNIRSPGGNLGLATVSAY